MFGILWRAQTQSPSAVWASLRVCDPATLASRSRISCETGTGSLTHQTIITILGILDYLLKKTNLIFSRLCEFSSSIFWHGQFTLAQYDTNLLSVCVDLYHRQHTLNPAELNILGGQHLNWSLHNITRTHEPNQMSDWHRRDPQKPSECVRHVCSFYIKLYLYHDPAVLRRPSVAT